MIPGRREIYRSLRQLRPYAQSKFLLFFSDSENEPHIRLPSFASPHALESPHMCWKQRIELLLHSFLSRPLFKRGVRPSVPLNSRLLTPRLLPPSPDEDEHRELYVPIK